MSAIASQIVCSTVCWSVDQRKHQSSASLDFVRGIHRWPVNSPQKGPERRKRLPFGDVIMHTWKWTSRISSVVKGGPWYMIIKGKHITAVTSLGNASNLTTSQCDICSTGFCFEIKTSFPVWGFHCKAETMFMVTRMYFLHRNYCTGKMAFLYWFNPLTAPTHKAYIKLTITKHTHGFVLFCFGCVDPLCFVHEAPNYINMYITILVWVTDPRVPTGTSFKTSMGDYFIFYSTLRGM